MNGLDRLVAEGFAPLKGRRVGLLCHPASVDARLDHALDLMLAAGVDVRAVFGPQHGLMGETQDNMIEWEGSARGPIRTYSLYGATRKPTPDSLEGLDLFVVDLQDVGARYYTFVWTACLALEACVEAGVPMLVLDRPNPIGRAVEGPMLEPGFESFVGGHRIPARHGMTLGEIVALYQRERGVAAELEVVAPSGEDEARVWVPPSPNMPTRDTALVYPGACLLEGTNLSEGRGTCRPFESFGAPFLDARRYAGELNGIGLPGVRFRPIGFVPTFNKHVGRLCGGAFVHVTDAAAFRPVRTYVAAIAVAIAQSGLHGLPERVEEATFRTDSPEVGLPGFAWKLPPYEYVYDRMPFDVLAGNAWLRGGLESKVSIEAIFERMEGEVATFLNIVMGK